MNLPKKYRPEKFADIRGQSDIVRSLRKFCKQPTASAFIFAGGTGVGKTAAAKCMAKQLGCDVDEKEVGGFLSIASGQQDAKAVDELARHLRPVAMFGSGWRVAVINEAERMTTVAETVWLDVLEDLPARSVIIFTTNDLSKFSDRILHRCEVHAFEDRLAKLRSHVVKLAKTVWQAERGGRELKAVAEGLGVYDQFSGTVSFRLALQQLGPLIRDGAKMPETIAVPMLRTEDPHKVAARKAVATRKRNLLAGA